MAKSITLFLLILLFLCACSENSAHKEELPFSKIPSENILEESITLESAEDFFEFSYECVEGKSYFVDFYQRTSDYYFYPVVAITSPDGDVDSSYSFRCTTSGTYHFRISPPLQYDIWPLQFFYRLREYSSLGNIFDSKWIFRKRIIKAFDRYQIYVSSEEDLMRTIEFRNDSSIMTFYDISGDSLYYLKELYAVSEYADFSYRLDSTTLTFTDRNMFGSITDIYTRYSGGDLTWHGETVAVPEELLGIWYYKSNDLKSSYNHIGETVKESSSFSYNSEDESSYIISIMSDSLVAYSRGFGYVDSFTYTIEDSYGFLRELERSGSKLYHNQVHFWQDDDDYSLGYSCSEYGLFRGANPAASWKTTTPSASTNLLPGEPFECEVEGGDTIWLKLSLVKGKRYQIKYEAAADILNYSTFMVNSSTMEPEYFTEFYNAVDSGVHYLVVFVHRSESGAEVPPLSFTLSEFSFYD